MSSATFKSNRKAILQSLQASPQERTLPSSGQARGRLPFYAIRKRLQGTSVSKVRQRASRSRVPSYTSSLHVLVWKAYFHVVISNTVKVKGKAEEQYTDVTGAYNEEDNEKKYVFVPSSRAHRDQDDDALFGGRFYFGAVVGGHEAYVDAIIQHYRFHGLRRDIVAESPETCLARPR